MIMALLSQIRYGADGKPWHSGHATERFPRTTPAAGNPIPPNIHILMIINHHCQIPNPRGEDLFYPDLVSVSSELFMEAAWDTMAVAELIRSKSSDGRTPTFLYLGRRETALLKEHLAEAFGAESVVTLSGSYYMGLNIRTIHCERFFGVGGCKTRRPPCGPHLPARRDG